MNDPAATPPPSDDDLRPCGQCGAFTSLEVGGDPICESCYVTCGSCCQERDDDED